MVVGASERARTEQALLDVLRDFGGAAGRDQQRLKALLSDALGADSHECSVAAAAVVAAAKVGAAEPGAVDRDYEHVVRAAAGLIGDPENAVWATRAWRDALSSPQRAAITAPRSTDPVPVTVPRPPTPPPDECTEDSEQQAAATRGSVPRRVVVLVATAAVALAAVGVLVLLRYVGDEPAASVAATGATTGTVRGSIPSDGDGRVPPSAPDSQSNGSELDVTGPTLNPTYQATEQYTLRGDWAYWTVWLKPNTYEDQSGGWTLANPRALNGTVSVVPCSEGGVHGCLRYEPSDGSVLSDRITYQAQDEYGNLSEQASLLVTIDRGA